MKTLVKNLINPLLHRFGCEIVAYSRYLALVRYAFKVTPDFFFILVGANDGRQFDSSFYDFIVRNGCSGIALEPLTDLYKKLAENFRQSPNVRTLPLALHPIQKSCALHRLNPARASDFPAWAGGIASFSPDHHKRSGVPTEAIISENVQCVHLMELLARFNVNRVHLLQSDVEGFDLEVLKMIDFNRIRPLLIKFEHVNLSSVELREARLLLATNGYRAFREGPDTIGISRDFRNYWRAFV